MRHMVLNVDGSTCRIGRTMGVGWAVIAHFEGVTAEHHGALRGECLGPHELTAIIEGILFAHARGYAPHEVSLYTDDYLFGHAGWYLHEGNLKLDVAKRILGRVRAFPGRQYSSAAKELVHQYLKDARIHWVKGHNFSVDQERADYLAKRAAWGVLGKELDAELSFDDWLRNGLADYRLADGEAPSEQRIRKTWYAPFSGPLSDD